MPKLAQILAQREAQRAARVEQLSLERELLAQVSKTVDEGIRQVDLSPIVKAIKEIPEPPEPPEQVDLSPVLAKLEQIAAGLNRCMEMMRAEGRATRSSMPMPKEVDLSTVLSDLQWIKTMIALDQRQDVVEKEPPKKSWNFDIKRDKYGFISSIKAT